MLFLKIDDKCALPEPDDEVARRICNRQDRVSYNQCKLGNIEEITNAIRKNGNVFINYNLKLN